MIGEGTNMLREASWLEQMGLDYRWQRVTARLVATILMVLCLALFFRVMFVNFIDNYELGYKFDSRTGKTDVLPGSGYYVTPPLLVKVHHVDLRPMQVCINANQRVLNCKLVQFNKAGIELFLSWHGRNDYDGPGGGQQDGNTATVFSEILKSYAYEGSGKIYPFLTVLRELKPEETATAVHE